MGYYPTGQDEIDEEVLRLKLQLEHMFICKKCGTLHSKTKCPKCKSQYKLQRHNGINWL